MGPDARREWSAGWPAVLAATLGVSLTTLYVYSTGALMQPIQRDLGWTRTQITAGLTAATTAAAVIGPGVGAAVDRFGSRALAIPGVLLYCAAIALLSTATTPMSWWLLWGLVGLCSAGIKPTVWATAVSSLFTTSRGLALAVMLCGTGLGSASVPIVANALIETFGWRQTYIYLAVIWMIVCLPLVILFFRGARDKPARRGQAPEAHVPGIGVKEALRSRRYWFLALATMICSLVGLAFIVSIIPMLTGYGVSRATAAAIAGSVGVMSIVGRLAGGYLIDRHPPRTIAAIAVALPAASGALLLALPGSAAASALAIVLIGLSLGTDLGAATYLTGRYFGLRKFGTLFGIQVSAMALATGIGPLAASYSYDVTGSYRLMLALAIPLSIAAAAMLQSLGTPPDWSARAPMSPTTRA